MIGKLIHRGFAVLYYVGPTKTEICGSEGPPCAVGSANCGTIPRMGGRRAAEHQGPPPPILPAQRARDTSTHRSENSDSTTEDMLDLLACIGERDPLTDNRRKPIRDSEQSDSDIEASDWMLAFRCATAGQPPAFLVLWDWPSQDHWEHWFSSLV